MKNFTLALLFTAAMMLPWDTWSQQQLPIVMDFESQLMYNQWTMSHCNEVTGRTSERARGGEYSFQFFYTRNPCQYLISPMFAPANGTETMSLWYNIASNDWPEMFAVGFSSTTDDTLAFTWGPTVNATTTGWQQYTIAVPAGTKYAAIRSMAYDSYHLDIDDIYIGDSSCMLVSNLCISSADDNSLTLSWQDTVNDSATYSVFLVTTSYTTLLASGISGNSYTVSNLNANTEYMFGVRTDCSCGSTGMTMVGGRTACYAMAVPFIERFSTSLGSGCCWSGCSGVSVAEVFAGASINIGEPTAWTFSTGNFGDHYTASHNSSKRWLITPPVNFAHSDSAQLTFDIALTNLFEQAYYDEGDSNLIFMVLVSLDGGQTWADSNAVIWSNRVGHRSLANICSTRLSHQTIDLYRYSGNTIRIAFYAQASENNSYSTFHLDNVRIGYGPACQQPSGLTAGNNTGYSTTLNWSSQAGSFNIFDMSDGSLIATVRDTFYVLTGLMPMSTHTIGVVADCGNDESDTTTVTFTLGCAPMPLPFAEDFNSIYGVSTNECWGRNHTTSVANVLAGGQLALEHNSYFMGWCPQDNYYYANISGDIKQWLVTPEFDLSGVQSAQLSFDLKLETGLNSVPNDIFREDTTVAFVVLVSLDGGATWADSNTVWWRNSGGQHTLSEIVGLDYTNQVVNLNRYLGDTVRIAFYAQGLTSVSTLLYLFLDNVAVTTVPRCLLVNDVTVDSIVADSVWIHWSSTATAFDIEVWQDTVEVTPTIISSGTSAFIYGLDLNEDYQIRVRSDCDSGDYGEWSNWMGIHTGYCLPSFSLCPGGGIISVSFGGMTNTTGHPTTRPVFADFTSLGGTVGADTIATVTISYATTSLRTAIWVDWNGNSKFDNNELVFCGGAPNYMPSVLNATFHVQPEYELGEYRMRIIGSYNSQYTNPATTNACGASLSGWATIGEDYTLAVGPAPNCWSVKELQVDSVTSTSVFLSWTDIHNIGATYSIYNMDDTSLVVNGISGTSVEITGLNPSTRYTFGVVANCSPTDASFMKTITAKTDCDGVSCFVTITGTDSFGDGWESTIDVMQDGGIVGTFNFTTGYQHTQSFAVCPTLPVNFVWNTYNTLDLLDVISFVITNGAGDTVYTLSNGAMLPYGTFFTLDSACISTSIVLSDSVLLNISSSNPRQGTVGTNYGSPMPAYVHDGERILITAHPADGYVFDHWVVNYYNPSLVASNTVTTNPFPLYIDAIMAQLSNIEVIAWFRVRTPDSSDIVTFITSATDGGTIVPAPDIYQLLLGDSMSVNAVAADGHYFLYWIQEYTHLGIIDTIRSENVFLVAAPSLAGQTINITAHFEEGVSINVTEGSNVIVYGLEGNIVVTDAEGEHVAIYDMVGRQLYNAVNRNKRFVFRAPCNGVYMVRIGDTPARRVVIIR